MKSRHAFMIIGVIVTFFLLMNFKISESSEPVDVGVLDSTDLIANGTLTSVGNDTETYTGEVDWYIFTSAVNTTATITLSFETGNDYDLFLYDDPNGLPIMSSASSDNPEILIYEVTAFTEYLLSVAGWDGSPGNYTLTISPGGTEPLPPSDPVDTGVLDITDLVADGTLTSVGNDGNTYTGEVDWYIFTSAVNTTATITLSFETGNDYDLFLYDDPNSPPIMNATSSDNPEILIYEVAAFNEYLLSVTGWDGSPGDYTLTISPEDIEMPYKIDLPSGWSMISLPVRPSSLKVSDLFPDAVVVYGFEKGTGYNRVAEGEDLKLGKGYWILLDNAQNYTIKGTPIYEYTRQVDDNGWDMIGGCISPAKASIKNGEIVVIYSYVQGLGYQRVLESENLKAGKGYWILFSNVEAQCELRIKSPVI